MSGRVFVGAWLAFSTSLSMAASLSAEQEPSGEQLFVRHCARCHTTSGSGLPEGHPLLENFASPPADFTEPLFNSIEPASDWFLVVKHGGASMGMSAQMPAHAQRLTDSELEAVVAHLGSFADTEAYPPGELNFIRAQRTIKAFPETESLLLSRFESQDDGEAAWKNTVYHGRRLGKRWQVEGKLSQLSLAGEYEYETELGVKWAFRNRGADYLLTAGAEIEIPFEAGSHSTLIPYLAHALPLGGRFTLQGTLRSHLPTSDLNGGDLEVSEVLHWRPSVWPRGLFPGLEAVVAVPYDGDRELKVTLIPQLHLALSKRGHVAINVGVEIPLSGASFDYRVLTFLLWDMADGGFWLGW